jgi:anionic cell wall polymer biosynthesis LytR-Cps2A-Psr (LCP) family protein
MGDKGKKSMNKATKIIVGILSVFLGLVLIVGITFLVLYKFGEASLKASATSQAPTVEVDEQDKLEFEYANTIAWQDDWIAYDGKVYEYNEDTLNFILLGIDKHGELDKEENYEYGEVGQADAVFLVSLNNRDKTFSLICIPKHSMVDLEVYNEDREVIRAYHNQICLQYPYAGGGQAGLDKMKECVSDMFSGLPIHGACALDFDSIGVIVDMLGGIEVTIPEDLTKLNSSYTEGSTLLLTKDNAWRYLEYRDTNVLGSPNTRLTREKEFLKVAINVAIDKVKENPMIVSDIYQAVYSYMNTDISVDEAVYLSKQLLDYSITGDSFYQLTGEDKQVDKVRDDGSIRSYDDYYLDEDYLMEVMVKVFYTQVVLDEAQ